MKKSAAILISLFLLLALCACGSHTADEENSTEPERNPQSMQHETPTGEKISGMLYAVRGQDDILTNEFSFYGGTVTPERIAAGFTGWTGIKFRITSVTDEENKTVTVNWLSDSSFAENKLPENQREQFSFDDAEAMRVFMINSMRRSIRENMGEYDVIFTVNGEAI